MDNPMEEEHTETQMEAEEVQGLYKKRVLRNLK